jgi:hypothetical protein
MGSLGARAKMHCFARFDVVPVREHGDYFVLTEAQEQKRFRTGWFDHGNPGGKTFIGNIKMLWPDPVDHRLTIACHTVAVCGKAVSVHVHEEAAIAPDRPRQQIHRG